MQVEPMKPVLKAPGTIMLLKQRYVAPLSNVAFNFNVRRYNEMCTCGKHPFDAQNEGALIRKIMRGIYTPLPPGRGGGAS